MKVSKKIINIFLLGVVAVFLAAVLFYTFQPEQPLGNNSATMGLVHHTVWLVVLVGSMLVHFRSNFGKAIKYFALWVAIGTALFVGYSLKDDFVNFGYKLKAELIPHSGRSHGNKIEFRSQRDGHFVVNSVVDGMKIRFLIDTGASDVVLNLSDAERLGINLKKLSFHKLYHTANGIGRGAPVQLGMVKIGPIEIDNVRASVNGAKMKTSLLGMSFLSRIGGYEVVGNRLTLKR